MLRVNCFLCLCFFAQFVVCQFGFFQNDRQNQYGFGDFISYPGRRIRQRLNTVLHFQPDNTNNPSFIYPFNNRPVSNDYQDRTTNNVRFPGSIPIQEINRPYIPNYEPEREPKQSEGLSFMDFISSPNKPSFIEDERETNRKETGENNQYEDNKELEPSTSRPVFDEPKESNYKESLQPGFSNHSDGLIMGTVSNQPAFDRTPVFDEGPPIFESSSEPVTIGKLTFGDRNGEEETTPLPVLTPVPPSDSIPNRNFGSAGIFTDTCETVDGGVGNCIRIQICDPYFKLLKNPDKTSVDILRKSQCGFEGADPKVCCPLPGIPSEPPVPQTTTTEAAPQGKSIDTDLTPVTSLPEPPVCGVSEASFSRVVNGIPAKLGDFPWMALLGYHEKRGSGTRWLCGGSLVTSHHVLTAAHCIHNRENDLYLVRLGELDLAREDDGATPVDVLIRSKVKHEDYDSTAFTNDIGLLILDKDVPFTKLIRPICIPQDQKLRSQTFEKYNPLIAGWGDIAYRGPSASHLQVAQLPVVSNSGCKQAFSQYKKQVIDERVLCAGWKDGRQDACQGDSGGPLMQPIWNSQTYKTFFFQIGVVSFGKKCAEPGFPGVYTRVTHFVPWLEKNILNS